MPSLLAPVCLIALVASAPDHAALVSVRRLSAPADVAIVTAAVREGSAAELPTRDALAYRLLALVKQDAVVRVQKEPDDTVMTWPHLLTIEFLSAGVMTVFLLMMGLFINAPLEQLANGNITPAVAKAPWYFLGLQEMLTMFHPMVAGVTVPGMGLFLLIIAPYVDKNPSNKPDDRKWAISMFGIAARVRAATVRSNSLPSISLSARIAMVAFSQPSSASPSA